MGHVAATCQRGETCAKCVGKHNTNQCDSETARWGNCGREHVATSNLCLVLRKERHVYEQDARVAFTHKEERAALRRRQPERSRDTGNTTATGKARILVPHQRQGPLQQRWDKTAGGKGTEATAETLSRHKEIRQTPVLEKENHTKMRRPFARVTKENREAAPRSAEDKDTAILEMISHLLNAVSQLAASRVHTPGTNFALEALQAMRETTEVIIQ
ncbi:hypothetical protein HPB47_018804 [Ixodes persulcatus]|uniref:Uncharacterized protein n=1 Tax=Ixodes persulcatus TaxID=34615 RepID=A0AC60QJT9_IXOPE|nr:hypothetical protein HPB47_018804 [Ixodes persulcatus]